MILVEKIKNYRNSIQIDVPISVKTYAHHVVLEENDVQFFGSHNNQILHPADRASLRRRPYEHALVGVGLRPALLWTVKGNGLS